MKELVPSILAAIKSSSSKEEVIDAFRLAFDGVADKETRKGILDALRSANAKPKKDGGASSSEKKPDPVRDALDNARKVARILPKAVDSAASLLAAAAKERKPSKKAAESIDKLLAATDGLMAITGTHRFEQARTCLQRVKSFLEEEDAVSQASVDFTRAAFNALSKGVNFLLDKATKKAGLEHDEAGALAGVVEALELARKANAAAHEAEAVATAA
jgi:hypothetical protein